MPVSVALALGVALLIQGGRFGRTFFRTAYFLPVASTLVAMATVWQIHAPSQSRPGQRDAAPRRAGGPELADGPGSGPVHPRRDRDLGERSATT